MIRFNNFRPLWTLQAIRAYSDSTAPRANRRWHSEEREKLAQLYLSGRKCSSIAETLGRSRGSIYGQIAILDEQKRIRETYYLRNNVLRRKVHRPWTAEEDQTLLDLHARGYNQPRAAAQTLMRTRRSVVLRMANLLARHNLRPHGRWILRQQWTSEQDATLRKLRNEGYRYEAIAKSLEKPSAATVRARMFYLKLLESDSRSGSWDEVEDQKLVELYRDGKPYSELGRLLSRPSSSTHTRVRVLRKKFDLNFRKRGPKPEYRPGGEHDFATENDNLAEHGGIDSTSMSTSSGE